MEKRILEYENLLAKKSQNGQIPPDFWPYHQWTVSNFQHERLIHLLIMIMFIFLSLFFLILSSVLSFIFIWQPLVPIYLVTIILIITTIFYVKHYYFLENHIQKLYNFTPKSPSK